MHSTSYKRMEFLLDFYREYQVPCKNKRCVLDIGSYGMNGTYHDLFSDDEYTYRGLDMTPGPNVDIVPKNIYEWKEIADESYELVISGQAFEHIEYPWKTMCEIERILVPGGFYILIAPNAGCEHKAPKDCWRFYSDGMRALAEYAGLYVHHTSVAGMPSLENAREWCSAWNDCVLVAQKKPVTTICEEPFEYECRLLQDGKYHLGYTNERAAVKAITGKYRDEKKYILYGAGIYGKIVFDLLPQDRVAYFADGNKDKVGSLYCGKEIIGLYQLERIQKEYHVIITTSKETAREIQNNLRNRRFRYYC